MGSLKYKEIQALIHRSGKYSAKYENTLKYWNYKKCIKWQV